MPAFAYQALDSSGKSKHPHRCSARVTVLRLEQFVVRQAVLPGFSDSTNQSRSQDGATLRHDLRQPIFMIKSEHRSHGFIGDHVDGHLKLIPGKEAVVEQVRGVLTGINPIRIGQAPVLFEHGSDLLEEGCISPSSIGCPIGLHSCMICGTLLRLLNQWLGAIIRHEYVWTRKFQCLWVTREHQPSLLNAGAKAILT